MLRTLVLEGSLAQFGGPFVFDVSSVQEAVHALTIQVKGAYAAIRKGEFLVFADEIPLDEDEVGFNLGSAGSIRIVPVPVGSKRGGIFKVILGVALLGVGLAVGAGAGALLGIKAATFTMMGAGMLLNGIGMMLSPSPSMSIGDNEKANDKSSYLFNSAVNVCEEGNCIPVVYGKAYSGSIVVSSGLSCDAVDTSLANVTGLKLTAGYGYINASWSKVKGAYDYLVSWTGPQKGSLTTTGTSGRKNGLKSGKYTVSVIARNGSVQSKKAASGTVTVPTWSTSGSDNSDHGW